MLVILVAPPLVNTLFGSVVLTIMGWACSSYGWRCIRNMHPHVI